MYERNNNLGWKIVKNFTNKIKNIVFAYEKQKKK